MQLNNKGTSNIKRGRRLVVGMSLSLLVLLITACSSDYSTPEQVEPTYEPLQQRQQSKNPNLAYKHHVTIELPDSTIPQTLKLIVETCSGDTMHGCLVMHSELKTGMHPRSVGTIKLRVAPDGISAYKNIALETGQLVRQSISAEDLTEQVLDIDKRKKMLVAYRAKLEKLEQDSNASIDSLIKVASELSKVQSQIEFADGKGAELIKRIDTDELNITLRAYEETSFSGPVSQAFLDFGENLSEGISVFIIAMAFLLPWIVLTFILVWLIRLVRVKLKRDRKGA